jgi:hypothetical protein
MQAETPDSRGPDWLNEPSVFVIEVFGLPGFAFEAMSRSDAARVAGSRWFQRAIDEFLSKRHEMNVSKMVVRSATDDETSLFCEAVDEFSEFANNFFVTHMSGQA